MGDGGKDPFTVATEAGGSRPRPVTKLGRLGPDPCPRTLLRPPPGVEGTGGGISDPDDQRADARSTLAPAEPGEREGRGRGDLGDPDAWLSGRAGGPTRKSRPPQDGPLPVPGSSGASAALASRLPSGTLAGPRGVVAPLTPAAAAASRPALPPPRAPAPAAHAGARGRAGPGRQGLARPRRDPSQDPRGGREPGPLRPAPGQSGAARARGRGRRGGAACRKAAPPDNLVCGVRCEESKLYW